MKRDFDLMRLIIQHIQGENDRTEELKKRGFSELLYHIRQLFATNFFIESPDYSGRIHNVFSQFDSPSIAVALRDRMQLTFKGQEFYDISLDDGMWELHKCKLLQIGVKAAPYSVRRQILKTIFLDCLSEVK